MSAVVALLVVLAVECPSDTIESARRKAQTNCHEEVIALLESLVACEHDPTWNYLLGKSYYEQQRYEEARLRLAGVNSGPYRAAATALLGRIETTAADDVERLLASDDPAEIRTFLEEHGLVDRRNSLITRYNELKWDSYISNASVTDLEQYIESCESTAIDRCYTSRARRVVEQRRESWWDSHVHARSTYELEEARAWVPPETEFSTSIAGDLVMETSEGWYRIAYTGIDGTVYVSNSDTERSVDLNISIRIVLRSWEEYEGKDSIWAGTGIRPDGWAYGSNRIVIDRAVEGLRPGETREFDISRSLDDDVIGAKVVIKKELIRIEPPL